MTEKSRGWARKTTLYPQPTCDCCNSSIVNRRINDRNRTKYMHESIVEPFYGTPNDRIFRSSSAQMPNLMPMRRESASRNTKGNYFRRIKRQHSLPRPRRNSFERCRHAQFFFLHSFKQGREIKNLNTINPTKRRCRKNLQNLRYSVAIDADVLKCQRIRHLYRPISEFVELWLYKKNVRCHDRRLIPVFREQDSNQVVLL
jgi:hypothetical protein